MKKIFYEYLKPQNGRVPKDPFILDIGANIGIHSFFFAALKYRSHAFEPNVLNRRVLECKLDANEGFEKYLTIQPFGLSNKKLDKLCMQVSQGNMGGSYVLRPTGTGSTGDCSDYVRLKTLDEFWETELNREHVFLIKIDNEGMEPKAFAGAQKMLAEAPPAVIITEITPFASKQYGFPVSDWMRQMAALGHKINSVRTCLGHSPEKVTDEDFFNYTERFPEFAYCDFQFVHTETIEKFNAGEIEF